MTTGRHLSVGRPGGVQQSPWPTGEPAGGGRAEGRDQRVGSEGGGWPQAITEASADQVGDYNVHDRQMSRPGGERPQVVTKGAAQKVGDDHRPCPKGAPRRCGMATGRHPRGGRPGGGTTMSVTNS